MAKVVTLKITEEELSIITNALFGWSCIREQLGGSQENQAIVAKTAFLSGELAGFLHMSVNDDGPKEFITESARREEECDE